MTGNFLTLLTGFLALGLGAAAIQNLLAQRVRIPVRTERASAHDRLPDME